MTIHLKFPLRHLHDVEAELAAALLSCKMKPAVSSSPQLSPASLQRYGIKIKNFICYSPITEIISLTKEYLTKINALFHEPIIALSHHFRLDNREIARKCNFDRCNQFLWSRSIPKYNISL